jgi:hypothetical protein
MMALPQVSFGATKAPTCTLTATTTAGTATFNDTETVYGEKDSVMTLAWNSKNATKAKDGDNEAVALSGVATTTLTKDTTFKYVFSAGSKKATCSVAVKIVSASINEATLTTTKHNPVLTGTAKNVKTLNVKIYKQGTTKPLFTRKTVKVKNNKWSTSVTKKLPDGIYDVVVTGDKKVVLNKLVSATLTVGDVAASAPTSATTIVVEQIQLLIGGIGHAGGLLPLSYLQVINIGKEPATLTGFTVTQIGDASTDSILSLSTVDDTGLLRSAIGGVAGKLLFKNGSAFIPTTAVLKPGEMHLFTIKAALVPNVSAYVGTRLALKVAAVHSNAKATRAVFPIGGVQWTIAN